MKLSYTREVLEPVVKQSTSIAQVMRSLGFRSLSGGGHTYLSKVIKKLGIDTGHFLGQRSNCGKGHKGGLIKRHWSDVLVVISDGKIEKTSTLRRALIESGREYVCEDCRTKDIWRGRKLVIEIDHVDGNKSNNIKENLKFRCPNCHSQTETWCRSRNNSIKDRCVFCKKQCNPGRFFCSSSCANKSHATQRVGSGEKTTWPEREALVEMILRDGYLKCGNSLGVSDNAVRKHFKARGWELPAAKFRTIET